MLLCTNWKKKNDGISEDSGTMQNHFYCQLKLHVGIFQSPSVMAE